MMLSSPCMVDEAHTRRATRLASGIKRSFATFMDAFPPHRPYHLGKHTNAMMADLQDVVHRVRGKGERCYRIYIMPPRHGKSDLVSRRFPVWVLLNKPSDEVILTGYSGHLASEMSFAARQCMNEVGPSFGIHLEEARRSVVTWRTKAGGGVHAVGLGGTITGHGADYLIVDDYMKNREEAESLTMRDKVWDSFRNDLMTRLAPTHAVIIACTRWHADDLVGRILRETDPNFPKFEVIRFPAWGDDGWLFPERFSPEWYETQRAAVGRYAWGALFMGDPQPRHGNLLRADLIEWEDEMPPGLLYVRFWDLASTEKERTKDDPDYTVGVKAAMTAKGEVRSIWVDDVVRIREEAPKRDRRIRSTAEMDGAAVAIGIETVAGYKDAGTWMKEVLKGRYRVVLNAPDKDLLQRASKMEAIFEAGNVHCRRAPWNTVFMSELLVFKSGAHDDQVAGLTGAYELCLDRPMAGAYTGGDRRGGMPRIKDKYEAVL